MIVRELVCHEHRLGVLLPWCQRLRRPVKIDLRLPFIFNAGDFTGRHVDNPDVRRPTENTHRVLNYEIECVAAMDLDALDAGFNWNWPGGPGLDFPGAA